MSNEVITLTVTIEKVGDGNTRYTLNHEGGDLNPHEDADGINRAMAEYLEVVNAASFTAESLAVMKEKRQDMKARAKKAATQLEKLRTEGVVLKTSTDSLPF